MHSDLDINNIEYIDPNPASIIESLRSIGYTLETAIADLIDNSITANAKTISIDSPSSTGTVGYFLKNSATHTGPRIISHRASTDAFWGVTFWTPRL